MPHSFKGAGAHALERYPGLGVLFERGQNPYFQLIVEENLQKLYSKPVGRNLLREIARAAPSYRHDFPSGINVIFTPLKAYFVEGGYELRMGDASMEDAFAGRPQVPQQLIRKVENTRLQNFLERRFGIKKEGALPMTTKGLGIVHESIDQAHASDRRGTVCIINFHNARVAPDSRPYIYMAHELIHALHSLTGTKDASNDEPATIGLGKHAGDALTENQFLTAFGLPRRTHY